MADRTDRKTPNYVIEKDIPIPGRRRIRGPNCNIMDHGTRWALRKAFREMEVGDSFLMEEYTSGVYSERTRMGVEIMIEKQNGTGHRVWKIG